MTLHRDKMDLQVTPKKCKFAQLLSHTDGNVHCDKKDSSFFLLCNERERYKLKFLSFEKLNK